MRVTNREAWAQVAWADASTLFVLSGARGGIELWLHDAEGRRAGRRVLPPLVRLRRPSVAPGMLAVEVDGAISDIHRLGAARTEPIAGDSPTYSGDGALAYLDGAWINVLSPEGVTRRVAQAAGTGAHRLGWSPDGRRLVYGASVDDRVRFFVVDVLTGATSAVQMTTVDEPGNPTWSSDGRSLIFSGASRDGVRLWRVSADGGPAQPISDHGWVEAVETPEGLFARSATAQGIWRLDAVRAPVQVLPEPRLAHFDSGRLSKGCWTVVNGRVYSVIETEGRWRVISRLVSGGPITRVADIATPALGSLTVNPRTGEIAHAAVEPRSDIGLIRFRRR